MKAEMIFPETGQKAEVFQDDELTIDIHLDVGPQGPKGEQGEQGAQGDPGSPGETGPAGADGVSPSVTVTDIDGGHRITITDATGEHSFDVMDGQDGAGAVQDVQVDGTSVVVDGVANVPIGTTRKPGLVQANNYYGTQIYGAASDGKIGVLPATSASIKAATDGYKPIVPLTQGPAVFYGLAKIAGSPENASVLAPGQYTESAKSAISEMLNGSVSVSGATPTINALPGVRYVCGEVATIDIVTPETGIVDVVFKSGSTPAVLTVTPPSGMTMQWANGFDPSALEADTTYEINVMDGCLGVAGQWS